MIWLDLFFQLFLVRILHFFSPEGVYFWILKAKVKLQQRVSDVGIVWKVTVNFVITLLQEDILLFLTKEHIIYTQSLHTVSKRELHLEAFSVLHNDEFTHCAHCIFILYKIYFSFRDQNDFVRNLLLWLRSRYFRTFL